MARVIGERGSSGLSEEIVEQPVAQMIEETMYVAVGKDVKECESNLMWALQNSGGKKICILHVHQPAQMIPLMGTKFPASSMKEQEVKAYWEIERRDMHKILDEYLQICRRMGAPAEKKYIENESIEKGLVELMTQHEIKKLVMGAAATKQYSKKMKEIKSKKAIYVRLQAPAFCHVWFLCKGYLIFTREAKLYGEARSLPLHPNTKTDQPYNWRSMSTTVQHTRFSGPDQRFFLRVMSNPPDLHEIKFESQSSPDGSGSRLDASVAQSSPRGRDGRRSIEEWDALPRSSFQSSRNSTSSSVGVADASFSPFMFKDVRIAGSELSEPPPSILDGSVDDDLYDQLTRAMAEAEICRKDAFEEAFRRAKAEKDALDALRRARASENLYSEELRLRTQLEKSLANEDDRILKIKIQRDEVLEELRKAREEKSSLERKLAESHRLEKEFEQKIISAVELLQKYKNERDMLRTQRDNALKLAEELRKSRTESPGTHIPLFYFEFSFFEVEEATHHFDHSLKIGEGGYGSIYKGLLRQTQVAIKRLNPQSMQGPSEFQQEVEVLSKLRHPNLITLIGACPEAWTLIYEYLPNGSLEDRLSCKNNSPPLSWKTRICIAAGLCSVLIFLHSCKPQSIVHGDLKPSNILLDENFVCKLSDFGICRLISLEECSNNNNTICCRTDPKGTFTYMDPEFLATGELTPKSDVYSFGIILLQLLTGRSALGITREVQCAIEKGDLKVLLDPLAGDWPYVQAEQLARLALRCTEICRKNRPDLVSDVWKVLEPMKASCGGSSSSCWSSDEHREPPSYFLCPIFQEVMQDPHVAADGFTYEAEALRGWLESGHENSPMTNAKLAHRKFIPNRALRSAIQEWLQSK